MVCMDLDLLKKEPPWYLYNHDPHDIDYRLVESREESNETLYL